MAENTEDRGSNSDGDGDGDVPDALARTVSMSMPGGSLEHRPSAVWLRDPLPAHRLLDVRRRQSLSAANSREPTVADDSASTLGAGGSGCNAAPPPPPPRWEAYGEEAAAATRGRGACAAPVLCIAVFPLAVCITSLAFLAASVAHTSEGDARAAAAAALNANAALWSEGGGRAAFASLFTEPPSVRLVVNDTAAAGISGDPAAFSVRDVEVDAAQYAAAAAELHAYAPLYYTATVTLRLPASATFGDVDVSLATEGGGGGGGGRPPADLRGVAPTALVRRATQEAASFAACAAASDGLGVFDPATRLCHVTWVLQRICAGMAADGAGGAWGAEGGCVLPSGATAEYAAAVALWEARELRVAVELRCAGAPNGAVDPLLRLAEETEGTMLVAGESRRERVRRAERAATYAAVSGGLFVICVLLGCRTGIQLCVSSIGGERRRRGLRAATGGGVGGVGSVGGGGELCRSRAVSTSTTLNLQEAVKEAATDNTTCAATEATPGEDHLEMPLLPAPERTVSWR